MWIATGFFLLVALMVSIKAPVPHTPFLKIQASEGLSFNILLSQKKTYSECELARRQSEKAMLAACPQCRVLDWGCIASPGPGLQAIQSDAPLKDFSLQFRGGHIVFGGDDKASAQAACEEAHRQGSGICYPPDHVRPIAPQSSQDLHGSGLVGDLGNFDGWLFLASVALISFLVSLGIVVTKHFHGGLTFDQSQGVQRSHVDPTPRVGGIAIFLGLGLATLMQLLAQENPHPTGMLALMFAGLPAFGFGLAEDLTKSVGVAPRLLATMASALLAWWLTGISIQSVDIPVFDSVLALSFFSVAFTALAVGGVANAINIIDGFHGLAGGVSVVMLTAIAVIALQAGDLQLTFFSGAVAAAIAGFLLINFPLGRLFLGDGGAYLAGFLIGWCAVLLPARNPEISAWTSLLICAYPISETLFSMYRRAKGRLHVGEPDREHLHSLLHHVVVARYGDLHPNLSNAMVSPPLWAFAMLPAIGAYFFSANPIVLGAAFLLFCVVYGVLYGSVKAVRQQSLIAASVRS